MRLLLGVEDRIARGTLQHIYTVSERAIARETSGDVHGAHRSRMLDVGATWPRHEAVTAALI